MTVIVKSDSKGGLGCGAGSGSPLPLAGILLALVWGGRRRGVKASGARLFATAGKGLSGKKKKKKPAMEEHEASVDPQDGG